MGAWEPADHVGVVSAVARRAWLHIVVSASLVLLDDSGMVVTDPYAGCRLGEGKVERLMFFDLKESPCGSIR